MAAEELPGCTACAKVLQKDPLKLQTVNRMIRLETSTQNKKFPVFACPSCDAPMIALATKK